MAPESRHSTRLRGPQVSLVTLLLLIAAVAVWLASFRVQAETDRLLKQLPGLRTLARELVVKDPTVFTAVGKNPEWYGEQIAEVWVPNDRELCWALDAIELSGVAPVEARVALPAGRHKIEIRDAPAANELGFEVLVDNTVVLRSTRPKDWHAQTGSSGGILVHSLRQFEEDPPWELFRRRFMVFDGTKNRVPPQGPAPGVLVWVE